MGLCIISSNESSGKLEKMVLQFMRVQNLLFLLSYFVTETIHVNFLVGMLLNALHDQVKKIQKHIGNLSDLQTSHL